jgi:hypothetical protein
MAEADMVKYVVTTLGINAVCFTIWYIYHKAQSKAALQLQMTAAEQQKLQWTTMAAQYSQQLNAYGKLIEGHKEREDKNFAIMERYAETLEYHGACLARVETEIKDNQFCPLVRREGGKG